MRVIVPAQVALWSYGPFYFTYQDATPHTIDFDKLDQTTQDIVSSAIEQGLLICVDDNGNQVSYKRKKTRLKAMPLQEAPKVKTLAPYMEVKIRELLANGVTTISREIEEVKNIQYLIAAIQFETEGKNRQTVIDLLSKQLQSVQSPVQDAMAVYGDDVVEEVGETITIQRNVMSIEEEKEKQVRVTLEELINEVKE